MLPLPQRPEPISNKDHDKPAIACCFFRCHPHYVVSASMTLLHGFLEIIETKQSQVNCFQAYDDKQNEQLGQGTAREESFGSTSLGQGSRGSFGFVWFQKSKKEPQSGSCRVGSSAVRFLAVQETVRFQKCDSCATRK